MDHPTTAAAVVAVAPTRPSTPPRLEDLARRTARTLLLPYIINYATTHGPSDEPQEVSIIVNPRTGSLTMIDGGLDGTHFSGKEGLVPASKESIDSLPTIRLTDRGSDCAICLSEFEVGEEAKQMPCKHKYHAGCIDKWLGIQGSCPSCRFRMPEEGNESGDEDGGDRAAEEEEEEEGEGEEEEAEEEGGDEGEESADLPRMPTFVFHIYFAGRNNRASLTGPGRVNDGPEQTGLESVEEGEMEGEPVGYESVEDMDVDIGSAQYEDMDIDQSMTS